MSRTSLWKTNNRFHNGWLILRIKHKLWRRFGYVMLLSIRKRKNGKKLSHLAWHEQEIEVKLMLTYSSWYQRRCNHNCQMAKTTVKTGVLHTQTAIHISSTPQKRIYNPTTAWFKLKTWHIHAAKNYRFHHQLPSPCCTVSSRCLLFLVTELFFGWFTNAALSEQFLTYSSAH